MNNFKRILALLLVLVAVLAFVACGDTSSDNNNGSTEPSSSSTTGGNVEPPASSTTEKKYTYRVKVVDEDNNAVEGVVVQVCKTSCVIAVTDAEGWAYFTCEVSDGYHANIMSAPDGLEIPEGKDIDKSEYNFENGQTELTLTLKFVDKAEA